MSYSLKDYIFINKQNRMFNILPENIFYHRYYIFLQNSGGFVWRIRYQCTFSTPWKIQKTIRFSDVFRG